MNNRRMGAKGEKLAVAYLEMLDYVIIEQNYHASIRGELDIIAKDLDILVFVEVKLRKDNSYGSGREAIDSRKKASMLYAAQHYIAKNKLSELAARFDVIEITMEHTRAVIEHIQNAFECTNIKGW